MPTHDVLEDNAALGFVAERGIRQTMTTAPHHDVPITSVADGPRADLGVVGRLPLAVRDDIAIVAERVAWLLRFGRKVRIVPLLFVLVWPFLLPSLLRCSVVARRLQRRDDVQAALAQVEGLPFERAWDDEHEDPIVDPLVRDLVLLRRADVTLSFAVLGPPVIIAGFIVALVVAGR
ncbi:MAG TPA: hypothetical protein VGF99_15015 [Myxococcota bacterium]